MRLSNACLWILLRILVHVPTSQQLLTKASLLHDDMQAPSSMRPLGQDTDRVLRSGPRKVDQFSSRWLMLICFNLQLALAANGFPLQPVPQGLKCRPNTVTTSMQRTATVRVPSPQPDEHADLVRQLKPQYVGNTWTSKVPQNDGRCPKTNGIWAIILGTSEV